jgi:hypothetical protein
MDIPDWEVLSQRYVNIRVDGPRKDIKAPMGIDEVPWINTRVLSRKRPRLR